MSRRKRAFVTGGTGFLGAHLVETLVDEGWQVVALHRRSSDLGVLQALPDVELAEGDITDPASLRRGIPEGVDAVFHVAGSAGTLPHAQERTRYDINHVGTRNVVAACLDKRVGRLVHTSTVATYDHRVRRPIDEDSPANDWSRDPYVHSKRLADREVEAGIRRGLDAVFVHPCAIIGKYDKDTWSKAFREIDRGIPLPLSPPGALNVCRARRVAEMHVAAFHRGATGRHFIIGGEAVSLLRLFQEIASVMGRPGPKLALPAPLFAVYGWLEFASSSIFGKEPIFTPHTIDLLSQRMYADSRRAERELGFTPTPLRDMIVECHAWMIETGRLPCRKPSGG